MILLFASVYLKSYRFSYFCKNNRILVALFLHFNSQTKKNRETRQKLKLSKNRSKIYGFFLNGGILIISNNYSTNI